MPEYLAPGVYVEEIERGPKPIEGVATSTAAFLGETERGPIKPRFISSYGEFLRQFGEVYDPGKYLPYAVKSFFDNGGRRAYIARIVGAGGKTSTLTLGGSYTVSAVGPGAASDRIFVRIEAGTTKRKLPGETDASSVGFRLRIFYWSSLPEGVEAFDPILKDKDLPRPSIMEDFDDLSLDPNSPSYWEKRVGNFNSSLVILKVAETATLPTTLFSGPLDNGADGAAPGTPEYEGESLQADQRTGLAALAMDPYRDVAIVCAPGASDEIVQKVITHCELNRFRFAVVDSPAGTANAATLDPRSTIDDTKYAAYYHPWIVVSDPRSGNRVTIPPSGAVCGIYALTDNTRGVWKAPANETVAGALDLEYDVTHGEQEKLNPRGVNLIRRFPGRGIRVWGARTLSSDPLWKYVNVRRLFIFLEASIYYSTQWVVFEPNDPKLWARVKQTVTLFLRSQWREGALFGEKEEEAFTVAVGRETMTEDDILNGRLIVEIGIAPVRPAEFVIFRIYQKTSEAKE
ncbi:MAG TPA: phage tail sheath family protein [Allosphingosinicella sp.]|nr:phage tail sheath family protein [Allosphingosinicella sp.]